MNDNEARQYAWNQLCEKSGATDWTVGKKTTMESFFIHGWNARADWDTHKASECMRLADEVEQLRSALTAMPDCKLIFRSSKGRDEWDAWRESVFNADGSVISPNSPRSAAR